MAIELLLNGYDIRTIESEILRVYNDGRLIDYTHCGSILEVRKRLINKMALTHQDELLPDIIAFNDALTAALREMYDRAHQLWGVMKEQVKDAERLTVNAKCFLGDEYPALHPVQGDDRDDLWVALCDSGWNPLYEKGVTLSTLVLSTGLAQDESFESLIGMDCPPPNWNEGLDQELTKDLHLTSAFHHLFDHAMFALTDFIYVRQFETEINVEVNKTVTPAVTLADTDKSDAQATTASIGDDIDISKIDIDILKSAYRDYRYGNGKDDEPLV